MNQSRSGQTRDDILQAAQELFLTQGYGNTSMRDIAKAAGGYSVASLYNHFESKDALFTALVMERNPQAQLLVIAREIEGETAQAFLTNFLHRVVPFMLQHFDFIQLAQIDMREFGGRNMMALLQHYIPPLLDVMAKLQSLPGIRPMPPFALLRFIAGSVFGFVLTHQFIPQAILHQLSDKAWMEEYVAFVLRGVTVDSDNPASS